MDILERIRQRAASRPQHIVLPEGNDPRTVVAAAHCVNQRLARITLLGDEATIRATARENNLDLVNQLKTYALMQKDGIDFQAAKQATGYGKTHDHGIGAQILKDLGVRKLRLLTNHPPKVNAIEAFGLEIAETVGL